MRNISMRHLSLFILSVTLALIALSLCGCKTKYVTVPEYHFRDSTKMVYQHDSIFVHDSVLVNVETKGDTVYNTKSVTKFVYRDKVRRDTVAIVKRDSVPKIVEVEKALTASQSFAIKWFGVLVAVLAILLLWTFRKPVLAIVRRFI